MPATVQCEIADIIILSFQFCAKEYLHMSSCTTGTAEMIYGWVNKILVENWGEACLAPTNRSLFTDGDRIVSGVEVDGRPASVDGAIDVAVMALVGAR